MTGHRLVYMAHPVAGAVRANLVKAEKWVRIIEERFPDVAVLAPWITGARVWNDNVISHRVAQMSRGKSVICRCDEVWLVGEVVSDGMAEEEMFAIQNGVIVQRILRPDGPLVCLYRPERQT